MCGSGSPTSTWPRAPAAWVTTTDGTEYLDFSSGIAVTSTGHCHPHVVAAIQAAGRPVHPRPGERVPPRPARAARRAPGDDHAAGIDTFFFANSGAEATEAAVKLAKQVTGRPNIVVFQGSFHGRTHQAMAMTTSKTGYRGRPRAAAGRGLRRPVP